MIWLNRQEWRKSFELVPRVAVDLVVSPPSRKATGGKKILLTKRARPPFAGWWHLPGSFLLKGEKLEECAQRVAKEELGTRVVAIKLAGVFDNIEGDPRGHVIEVVYECKLVGEPSAVGDTAEVGWFDKLPENIGFGQGELLKKLGVL